MRILRFHAENVKRLKVVNITPSGSVVQITGANGSGKTSVLDAIFWALAGKSAITRKPIRDGEQTAVVELDLGDETKKMTVRRTFDANGTTLVVESCEGARFPSPQAMLNSLLDTLTFDPLAFTRLKASEQAEALGRLVGLTEPLRELDAKRQVAYDARTDANREMKRLRAAAGVINVTDPNAQPVDVAALMEQIDQANAAAQERTKHQEQRERFREEVRVAQQQVAEAEERLRRYQKVLAAAQAELVEFQALPEPFAPADTAPLRARMLHAQRINDDVASNQRRDELMAQAAAAQEAADDCSAMIRDLDETKALLIREAQMPLPGLALDDVGVTLNGQPLEQASSAEQLRASVAMAMAGNAGLRVLRIQDGSLLDEDSLALLHEMADTHDFQVWLEVVDTSGTVGIVMEDGTARVAGGAA